MRIYFNSLDHAKRLSKRLSKSTGSRLNLCQNAVANIFGYKDWHELEKVSANTHRTPSKPDQICSHAVVRSRHQYQSMRLSASLGLPFDAAKELIALMRPTASMPYDWSDSDLLVDTLFPPVWRFVVEDDSESAGQEGPSDTASFVIEIGGHDSNELMKSLAENTPEITREFDHRNGIRVLTVRGPVDAFDVKENKPFLILFFHIVPVIEESIFTRLEIDLSVGFCSVVIPDYVIEMIVMHFIDDYINQPVLHVNSPLPISGCVDGVDFILSGMVKDAGSFRFYSELISYITFLKEDFYLNESIYSEIYDEVDSRCIFPIASITDQVEVELDDENEELAHAYGAMQDAKDFFLWLAAEMNRAPELLKERLHSNGKAEIAEWLGNNDSKDLKSCAKFLADVRVAELALALESEISFFVHHYFIDCHAATLQDLNMLDNEDEAASKQYNLEIHIRAAHDFGATHMAQRYKSEGMTAAYDLAAVGRILLLGE